MTNRQFFFIGCLCVLSWTVNAAPRTMNEALNEANQFLSRSSTLRSSGGVQFAYTCPENAYYVFNCPNEEGFVIISGDDRAKTVLGYTESGSFDFLTLPDNFKYWLSCYERELKALMRQEYLPESFPQSPQTGFSTDLVSSIAPMILTLWGQDAPFNNLCPVIPAGKPNAGSRTVSGCVATTMAQIMKYYEWPDTYSFSKSYTTQTLEISINESFNGTYTWANMSNSYNVVRPVNQTEVAALMYHCGVAVEMDYDTSSGAYSPDVPFALSQVFGYDANMQIYMRDYYTDDEWKYMIMSELNAGRPVYYSGVSSAGGHAFVCDGYDADGFFHFNWGWRGVNDGYFTLSALNPSALGANDSFSSEQTIITGIQRPNSASIPPPPQILLDNPLSPDQTSVGRNQKFSITATGLWNMGAYTFSGYLGIGLYDANDQSIYQDVEPVTVGSGYGWRRIQFYDLSVPGNIPDGNYRLYIIYSTDKAQWYKSKAPVNLPSHINVTVTSATISFLLPTSIQTPLVANTIIVYPNPADEELVIQSPEFLKNIAIFDSLGKKWMEKNIQAGNSASIPVAGLPTGNYIVQIETNTGFFSSKFTKR